MVGKAIWNSRESVLNRKGDTFRCIVCSQFKNIASFPNVEGVTEFLKKFENFTRIRSCDSQHPAGKVRLEDFHSDITVR